MRSWPAVWQQRSRHRHRRDHRALSGGHERRGPRLCNADRLHRDVVRCQPQRWSRARPPSSCSRKCTVQRSLGVQLVSAAGADMKVLGCTVQEGYSGGVCATGAGSVVTVTGVEIRDGAGDGLAAEGGGKASATRTTWTGGHRAIACSGEGSRVSASNCTVAEASSAADAVSGGAVTLATCTITSTRSAPALASAQRRTPVGDRL